jgi:hypothetical protein
MRLLYKVSERLMCEYGFVEDVYIHMLDHWLTSVRIVDVEGRHRWKVSVWPG